MQISNIAKLFVLPVCLGLAAPALAAPALTPYAAEYRVHISILGGKLTTRLEALEGGYRAESAIQATGMSRLIAHGSIRENSMFSVTPEGLRPTRYQSSDTLSSDGQMVDLEFHWDDDSGVVSGQIDGADFSAALAGPVQDRVSLQYGLMYDLMNGGEKSEYALQDAEEYKPLAITNIGRKTVNVPFGKFEAIGIQHHAENSSRITTLWCAEDLGYLPVIIEQHRDGKLRVRAELSAYRQLTSSAD